MHYQVQFIQWVSNLLAQPFLMFHGSPVLMYTSSLNQTQLQPSFINNMPPICNCICIYLEDNICSFWIKYLHSVTSLIHTYILETTPFISVSNHNSNSVVICSFSLCFCVTLYGCGSISSPRPMFMYSSILAHQPDHTSLFEKSQTGWRIMHEQASMSLELLIIPLIYLSVIIYNRS